MNHSGAGVDKNVDTSWLIEVASRVLGLAVKFVVGKMTCVVLIEILKEAYITEATQYLQQKNPGKPVTHAALAAVSGLDGRAIKEIKAGKGEFTNAELTAEAKILEMWATNPLYQDEHGDPAVLRIHGPGRTFQGLVRRAAGRAVTPQTVMHDLLENSNVEVNAENDTLKLCNPHFSSLNPSDKVVIISGSHATDRLVKAVTHNMKRAKNPDLAPWVQKDRWSMRIPVERVDAVRAEITKVLEQNVEDVVGVLGKEEDEARRIQQVSVGVGWYYWEEGPEEGFESGK
jgi:hypothetical protein